MYFALANSCIFFSRAETNVALSGRWHIAFDSLNRGHTRIAKQFSNGGTRRTRGTRPISRLTPASSRVGLFV